jgi:hypothetical protein
MSTSIHVVTNNFVIRRMMRVIPEGYRRLIVLSSLIAYITNTDRPEKDFIRNMDQALQLSRGGESALELPVRLSRVFWGNREVFRDEIAILTDRATSFDQKQHAAEAIAISVPDWFQYGTPKKIVDDLVHYFTVDKPELAMA